MRTWNKITLFLLILLLITTPSYAQVSVGGIVVQEIEGDELEGSGELPRPVLIGGDDGTDVKNIAVDPTTGNIQIDILSQVPGTGATNLGKAEDAGHSTGDTGIMIFGVRNDNDVMLAGTDLDYIPLSTDSSGHLLVHDDADATIDSPVGATDQGNAMLAKHQEDQVHLTTADGDYDILTMDSLGSLHVNAEAHHVFDSFNVTTDWTVLSDDTTNLVTTKKHVTGTDALSFDKANGDDNTIFAGIQKTLSPSVDLGSVAQHDLLQGTFYLPDLDDVAYAFLRLGTDSSNYNEWQLPVDALTGGIFETGALLVGDADYDAITGNGWDSSAITYIVVGIAFSNQTDTLSGIVFDEISYHTNQHTAAILGAEVTSEVSTPNVNLHKIGGSVTDKGAGNSSNGSQRIVIATNDVNQSAIKTAVEIMDDWDNGASDGASVSGTTAHDAAGGSIEPVAIGAYAIDYDPDTEDEQGRSEVSTDEDISRVAINRRGEIVESVNPFYHLFNDTFPDTGLDGVYDDSPTNSTSEGVEVWNYRECMFVFGLDSTNTPTDMQFEAQFSYDNSAYFKFMNGAWGTMIYEDSETSTELFQSLWIPVVGKFIRFKATCTGCTASNTFTIDDSGIMCRN